MFTSFVKDERTDGPTDKRTGRKHNASACEPGQAESSNESNVINLLFLLSVMLVIIIIIIIIIIITDLYSAFRSEDTEARSS